ncbi:2-amino-4-hydroxy-6-hydroxymethyldihydropteridine diphosphokinase [Paenibacillus sp.]|uniref:2-amino-4-hydroxy-6- hydroxymethyldihydropteridine diphosphokinase n=1 Tax=Paenibacillus sp. TaxID=58172 RepID=UPI002D5711CE|nr:2-amino-4-hydroxy-6-hydroxymethyldihydropteridine diphosphokinase [Paenibacillus sp.]HZG55776.1 2-amino-4-hydroxy-6-hydroxymethyldihydropteridine diphosphokinase [Paenibacillus sp.]
MNTETAAYLGLGSNIGARESSLAEAVRRLNALEGVRVTDASPLYETDPVGYTDQPPFLNMVCRIVTAYSPEALLEATLGIERELGRTRDVRWGPRTIDIDILLYGDATIETPDLTVPHPRLAERSFVLVPLMDVLREEERDWRPGFRERVVDGAGVRIWNSSSWRAAFGHSES